MLKLLHPPIGARNTTYFYIFLLLLPLILQTGCGKNSDSASRAEQASPPAAGGQGTALPIPDNVSPETKERIAREMAEAQERARISTETQQKMLPQNR